MTLHDFAILILAAPAGGDAAASSASTEIQSVWDFVRKGGWMMVPIGLCSFIALTVLIERLATLRRSRIISPAFLPGLKKVLRSADEDRAAGLNYCRKHPSPVARVFEAGIKKLGKPAEQVEKHIVEAGQREVLKLRKNLRVLSVIAAVAPLLGLLGTIFGMIEAFQTVATSGEALGKTEMLASGIYQAMITTAAGLIVAIPSLIFYHWLSAKIEKLVMEIDHITVDFIEEFADPDAVVTVTPDAEAEAARTREDMPPGDVAVAAT